MKRLAEALNIVLAVPVLVIILLYLVVAAPLWIPVYLVLNPEEGNEDAENET